MAAASNVLLPAFALIALTLFVQVRLGLKRVAALKARRVDMAYYKTYDEGREPADLRAWSRHLVNLYEAPVLFYALVVIAYVTGQAGALPVGLAWAYVALRFVHSGVHLGSNNLLLRFRVFAASFACLVALAGVLLAGILLR